MSDFKLKLTDYEFYFLDQGSPNIEENFYDVKNKIPWVQRVTTLPKTNYFVITDDAKLRSNFLTTPLIFDDTVVNGTVHWQNKSTVNNLNYYTSGIKWVGLNKFEFELPSVGSSVFHAGTAEQAYDSGYKEIKKILEGNNLASISDADKKNVLIWNTIGADVKHGIECIHGAHDATKKFLTDDEYKSLLLAEPFTYSQSIFYKTVYKSPHRISKGIKENTVSRYDIVFISYNEPNAEENWQSLKARFPRAKRVHGIKGIHQAHIEAAKLCTSPMFWIVDGDAKVDPEFKFTYKVPDHQLDHVHVWRAKNPINGLEYGYGGVKLFPRKLTIEMDTSKPDMTTSVSDKFKPMNLVSNITAFNTSPFETWKGAFRECVKLASKSIDRQHDEETEYRLTQWQFEGANRRHGDYAQMGAKQGQEYGEQNSNDTNALKKINDFDWLLERFERENKRH
jgi:hypothetical protein|tara:strand:- start:5990 stop:7342 length:1353 start_codon:yes stop_codon:yes gene_type:complete